MNDSDEIAMNSEVAQKLAGIWRDVLGKDDVTVESDFFELGGDSLQLMTMLFRIYQDCGIELDPGIVFESPTVAQIAAIIVDKQRAQCSVSDGLEGAI